MSGARPILVVDDDETIVTSVEYILVEEGYRVAVAVNGKEALQRASDDPPCLVLLDREGALARRRALSPSGEALWLEPKVRWHCRFWPPV